jgi:hypothetical protein
MGKLPSSIDSKNSYVPRYKPIGRNIGGIKGQRDGFESYAVRSLMIEPHYWILLTLSDSA